MSANEAAKSISWLTHFLSELGINTDAPTLFIDNRSTIKQIENEENGNMFKHIEIKYYYVREQYKQGLFKLEAVPSQEQLADLLTKPLSGPAIKRLLENHSTFSTNTIKQLIMRIKVILTLLLYLDSTLGFRFERVAYNFWQPTDYQVDDGLVLYDYDLLVDNPCSQLPSTPRNDSDIIATAYNDMAKHCESVYGQQLLPIWEELILCKNTNTTRPKRDLGITAAIAAGATIGIAAYKGAEAVYDHVNTDSDNNRLYRIESREQRRDAAIKELQAKFQRLLNSSENSIDVIDSLHERVETNRKSIYNLARLIPDVAWKVSRTTLALEKVISLLRPIVEACKSSQLAPLEVGTLLNIPELKRLKPDDTTMVSTRRVGGKWVNLRFQVTRIPSDTFVYQVESMSHWGNVTASPTPLVYTGPPYVVHNLTANCTIGISKPTTSKTQTRCSQHNYYDEHLRNWAIPTNSNTIPVQIHRTPLAKLVYCLYQKISILGMEIPCPPHAFKIPIHVPFSLPNYTHEVITTQLRSEELVPELASAQLSDLDHDEDYDREFRLINTVKALHDSATRPEPLTEWINSIEFPNTWWDWLEGLAIGAFIFTTARFLFNQAITSWRGQTQVPVASTPVTENVTIYNAPPPPPPTVHEEPTYDNPYANLDFTRVFRNHYYPAHIEGTAV